LSVGLVVAVVLCWYENGCVIIRKEHRIEALRNEVPKTKFGPKREKVSLIYPITSLLFWDYFIPYGFYYY
jgi:hypothetical protein